MAKYIDVEALSIGIARAAFFRAAALSLMKLSTLSGNSERGHGIFQFYRRKRHHNIMSKEAVIKHLDNLYNRMYVLSL